MYYALLAFINTFQPSGLWSRAGYEVSLREGVANSFAFLGTPFVFTIFCLFAIRAISVPLGP